MAKLVEEFPESTERSPYKARGDHREYNVYIQTARVEAVWPRMPDWPLAAQIGPLLVSLEVVLKILEDTEWNLDVFFRNFQKLFPKVLGAEHEIVEQGDNHLRVTWTLEAESFLMQMAVRFSGTETFYFDPQGRIQVAFAEWNPAALAADIMQRHRAALAEAAAKSRPA